MNFTTSGSTERRPALMITAGIEGEEEKEEEEQNGAGASTLARFFGGILCVGSKVACGVILSFALGFCFFG